MLLCWLSYVPEFLHPCPDCSMCFSWSENKRGTCIPWFYVPTYDSMSTTMNKIVRYWSITRTIPAVNCGYRREKIGRGAQWETTEVTRANTFSRGRRCSVTRKSASRLAPSQLTHNGTCSLLRALTRLEGKSNGTPELWRVNKPPDKIQVPLQNK